MGMRVMSMSRLIAKGGSQLKPVDKLCWSIILFVICAVLIKIVLPQ